MNKINFLIDLHKQSNSNNSVEAFLFAIDLMHFRLTGRSITNAFYWHKNGQILIEYAIGAIGSVGWENFTKREIMIINQGLFISLADLEIKQLPEGLIDFKAFLREKKDLPLAVINQIEMDEFEREEFKKVLES